MQKAATLRVRSVWFAVAMLGLTFAVGCGGGSLGSGGSGGGNPPPPPASSVTLTPTSATIHAGETVTFKATVNGTTDQTLAWSVNGVVGGNASLGTVSTAGLYQAPAFQPTPNPVTVRAVSVTNSNAAATSSITIDNPQPHIAAVTPDSFQSPASFTLTITGSGFVNGAVVNWGSTQIPATYISGSQLSVSGTQSTVVKVTPVTVRNPDPGGLQSNAFYVVTDPAHTVSNAVAARVLQQTSWGPRPDSLPLVQVPNSLQAYLNVQFGLGPSPCYPPPAKDDSIRTIEERFFVCAQSREDQLRQRVAFALSQIMVTSANKVNDPTAMTLWSNMFMNDAFGNYYDLLKDVTLSPVMGNYLDMVNNDKPDPVRGTAPNENYAREVMQLFSIGLEQLNLDGTQKLDSSGNPIPTYNQDTIEGFAHAFTGWTYPPKSGSPSFGSSPNYTGPMVPVDSHHDTGAKTLLDGYVIPAGGTAQSDMDAALHNIFNHPNVGPFICKQLIQHLVTSNPSPEYVGRVATVFNDNGSGVRGDLKAVISAIILDPEARRGDDPSQVQANDGHMKEPLLLMMNLMRAMSVHSNGDGLRDYAVDMKQEPLNSPSVFNFYHPTFVIPTTTLLGPEFELFNTSTTITRANFVNDAVYGTIGKSMSTDLSYYLTFASSPDQLVDRMNQLMMHGGMSSEMRSELVNALSGINDNTRRVQAALYLIASSSQYQVEH